MERWWEQGTLSDDEFDTLVRLVARYAHFEVDQFDHWRMPGPAGMHYVDFNQGLALAPEVDAWAHYRTVWPGRPPELADAWSVWSVDADGAERLAGRFRDRAVADTFIAAARSETTMSWRLQPPADPQGQVVGPTV